MVCTSRFNASFLPPIHGLCAFFRPLLTPLSTVPFFVSLSIHGLHFTVYAPSISPISCKNWILNFALGDCGQTNLAIFHRKRHRKRKRLRYCQRPASHTGIQNPEPQNTLQKTRKSPPPAPTPNSLKKNYRILKKPEKYILFKF